LVHAGNRCKLDTPCGRLTAFIGGMPNGAPPTVRQVYALAAVLCELCDEQFPKDREAASALIERSRREAGHPNPRLDDTERARRPRHGGRGTAKLADAIARRVAKELQ
jgi:hypothetical protein